MRLYFCLLAALSFFLLSFDRQENPLHKKWNLIAEETVYVNFDNTKYDNLSGRIDSVKGITIQFLPDGSYKSSEGDGSYNIAKDSIYLSNDSRKSSFKFDIKDSKLLMETSVNKSEYIVKSVLHLSPAT
ncbi:hypothetical protein E2P86_10415 [Sphingobacterium psychroaquaticum]|uniref:hypothetical protein n=1 Tax=Sphingobacterium psychroaquaticum TaxID=561061 RepID=UPI00106D672A|nr:hypothetical protein [Sphingobacterium psychroaquaticum]QBQ41540.1 hypothetical protein E2P86_10415 [Sphingobacterium psychroaquaticum]